MNAMNETPQFVKRYMDGHGMTESEARTHILGMLSSYHQYPKHAAGMTESRFVAFLTEFDEAEQLVDWAKRPK